MLILYHILVTFSRNATQKLLQTKQVPASNLRFINQAHPAACGSVQHPLRHFKGLGPLISLKPAAAKSLAIPHERFTDRDRPAIPGMPRIADLCRFGNMGVGLSSSIMRIVAIVRWKRIAR